MVDEQLLVSNWILNKASMGSKKHNHCDQNSPKQSKPLNLTTSYYIGLLAVVVILFVIS